MPPRKHNLPTAFDRLDDRAVGDVLDSIVIHARSRGVLHMPGEYSTQNRPPGHRVSIVSTDTDNASVYTEQHQLGGPDHYRVNYDVWNHRDSPTFADLVLIGDDSTSS
jgi:hypothetical protein